MAQLRHISNSPCVYAARGVAVMLAALFLFAPGIEAKAQTNDIRSLVERLDGLERDLSDVQREVYRRTDSAGTPAGIPSGLSRENKANARLSVRMSELEEQIRLLTGKVEQYRFQIDSVQKRLDKLVADVDFRLTAIEQQMAAPGPAEDEASGDAAPPAAESAAEAPADSTAGKVTPKRRAGTLGTIKKSAAPDADKPILPDGSVEEQYRFAYTLLQDRDFDKAERAFREFLSTHPDSTLAGNAQYWLGESYFGRGNYKNAATTFLDGYERYPNSVKAPDNLLKLGITLNQLGHKEDACSTLGKLATEFPDADKRIKRSAARIAQKANCK